MNLPRWILLALISINMAFASEPLKRFFYKIKTVNPEMNCEVEAQKLGLRFAELTKTTVSETMCNGSTMIVAYMSETEIRPFTVFYGTEVLSTPQPYTGVYLTAEDCRAELQSLTNTFEVESGYSAIASTCQESSSTSSKTWVLRIDGVGEKLKQRFWGFTANFFGQADEILKKHVEYLATFLGGNGVHTVGKVVYYYSSLPLPIRLNHVGNFKDHQQCLDQINEVKAMAASLGSKKSLVNCLVRTDRIMQNFLSLEIVSDLGGKFPFSTKVSELYDTFAQCMSGRAIAIEEAQSRGQRPVGAICKDNFQGKFEMDIYRK